MGHEAVIYPEKNYHDEGAQVANQEEEDRDTLYPHNINK